MPVINPNIGPMLMKTMSALEAKNSFDQFLSTVQREPVVVTKNSREVAAMFSVDDLQEMASSFLAEPLKADFKTGKLSVIEALMSQVKVNQRVKASRQAIAEGKGIVADEAYFDGLRTRIMERQS